MRPKVVIQNEVSIDGAIDGFGVHMGTYYALAAKLGADADMFGSHTMLASDFPERPETVDDLRRPVSVPGDWRHLWYVTDSDARLSGRLHLYRNSQWCLDLVMLITENTAAGYREYLDARDYPYIVAGRDRVDLRRALEEMYERFGVRKVRVDSGGLLGAALLERGLADELSLLISPHLVGSDHRQLFRALKLHQGPLEFKLAQCESLDLGLVHLLYELA